MMAHEELLARLDLMAKNPPYNLVASSFTCEKAAAALRKTLAELEAEREAREKAEREYGDCRSTLKYARYCHGQTIAQLKNAASEEIKAANQRTESAEPVAWIDDNGLLFNSLKEPDGSPLVWHTKLHPLYSAPSSAPEARAESAERKLADLETRYRTLVATYEAVEADWIKCESKLDECEKETIERCENAVMEIDESADGGYNQGVEDSLRAIRALAQKGEKS